MPAISIMVFCKDRQQTIGRAIDSILAQTFKDLEIVVQDGASTDGTREILESYGSALTLVSEPDTGCAEAFIKALRRCEGTYIGSCLSDEELLPDAVERAVAWLEKEPSLGAITGNADIIDFHGRQIGEHIGGPFNLVRYMASAYCPYFVSSFFRRQALVDVGLIRAEWEPSAIEFEIWCRLAAEKEIRYVSEKFGRYGIHPGQLSNTAGAIFEHMDGRSRILDRLFAPGGILSDSGMDGMILKWMLLARQSGVQYHHMMCVGQGQLAGRFLDLFLLYTREMVRSVALRDGLAYDDPAVTEATVHDPGGMFRADDLGQAVAGLLGVASSPLGGTQGALPEVPFPAPRPAKLVLPEIAEWAYRTAAQSFEQRGLHRLARDVLPA